MFDFPSIYSEIVDRAGGEQSTAEDVLRVERGITLVLQDWMNKRYPTWRVCQMRTSFSGYTPEVQLPEDVDDVLQVTVAETGSVLRRVPPSVYMQLTSKTTQGTPGQFWLNRSHPPKLMLYPIGTPGTVQSLELWYVATAPGARGDPGSNVVPQRWLKALIVAGAHDLASKRPMEGGGYDEALIARLNEERLTTERDALNADRDRARFTYRIR